MTAVESRLGTIVTPLRGDESEPVDPASSFEVRLPLPVRNGRLVLLDARDAIVPARAETEVGPSGTRFTLVPVDPLPPGSRAILRLEGLESRLLRADDSRTFEPLAIPVRVSGSPPAPPPKKPKKRRH